MILCISFSRQPPPVVSNQGMNEVHGNRHNRPIKKVGQNCPAKFTAESSDGSDTYTSSSESSTESEDPSVHASANFESGSSSGSSLKSTAGESDSAEEVVGEENNDHQGDGDVMKQLIDPRDIKPLVDSSGRRVVAGEGSHGKAFLGNFDGTIVIVKTMTSTQGNILSRV